MVLRYQGRQLTVHFSQGYAINGRPKAKDVLGCLSLDTLGIENARDFSDWCAEYGYSDDSRKAERTYKTIQKQAAALRRLLGDDYEAITTKAVENF